MKDTPTPKHTAEEIDTPYFKLSRNEYGRAFLMYKPDKEPGRYRCWEPIDEEFYVEFEKLSKLKEERKWISVEIELPESGKQVLCNGNKGKHFFVGFYTKGKDTEVAPDESFDIDVEDDTLDHGWLKPGWYEEEETPHSEYDSTYLHRDVTHWQPLPEVPTP